MARPSAPPNKHPAELSPGQLKLGIERLGKLVERVRQFNPQSVTEQFNIPHVHQLSAAIDEALVRTFGPDTLDYDRYRFAAEFDNGPYNYAFEVPIQEVQQSLARSQARNIALIEQAIEALKDRLSETSNTEPVGSPLATQAELSKRVFVVHGHAGEPREALARFLAQLGLEPIVLHEQANKGRTIIEKFEAHADVGFAVVLLTPDDFGGSKDGDAHPRARQNVILELGYFIGRLERPRVCALKVGDLELPSDIFGIAWTSFDDGGGWKLNLAKELKEAGYSFDWEKVAHG